MYISQCEPTYIHIHSQKESLVGQTLSLDPNSAKTVISVSGLYILKEHIKTTIHISKIKHCLLGMKRDKAGYSSVQPKKTAFVCDRFTFGPIVQPRDQTLLFKSG